MEFPDNKYEYSRALTKEDFDKWIKEIFSDTKLPKQTWYMMNPEIIQCYYNELGKERFRAFIESSHIYTSEAGMDLINKLLK